MQNGTGAKKFLFFGTSVSAVKSKLHSTCPAQHFDDKFSFENCF